MLPAFHGANAAERGVRATLRIASRTRATLQELQHPDISHRRPLLTL